ncbi:MAG: DUF456 family protein [candidate division WS1 bacterium]|jgi:uncharacterized protein YqgC (DUF456 family)|nr:DUF456 family protein [candidate division WS1 bacterium]
MSLKRSAATFAALLLMMLAAWLSGCDSVPPEQTTAPEDEVAAPAEPAAEEPPAVEVTPEEEPSADEAVADEPASEPEDEAIADSEPLEETPPGLGSRFLGGIGSVSLFIAKLLFIALIPAAIAGTLLGLPGSVILIAAGLIFSAFHGWQAPPWWVLLIMVAIAVVAEVLESAFSFAGAKGSGASTATGIWTIVGGFVGAVIGGVFGPLLGIAGVIIGPLALGMVGGFLGGYLYEVRSGTTAEDARKAGWSALLGRLAGSFTKALLVAVMGAILLISTWGALF